MSDAELRRKNLGKQYALKHIPTRKVFDWHRPGEPLPKLVVYEGKKYLLTQADVDKALAAGRTHLVQVETESGKRDHTQTLVAGTSLVVMSGGGNRKGAYVAPLRDSKWDRLKDIGVGLGIAVAACGAAALVAEGVLRSGVLA